MRTVGAISASNKDACIYFCDVSKEELESLFIPTEIKNLVKEKARDSIMLAIESEDDMQEDLRCIGLMFISITGTQTASMHQSLQPFKDDMAQIFQWEYCPKQEVSWD